MKVGGLPPPAICILALGDLPGNGSIVPIFIVETLKTEIV